MDRGGRRWIAAAAAAPVGVGEVEWAAKTGWRRSEGSEGFAGSN